MVKTKILQAAEAGSEMALAQYMDRVPCGQFPRRIASSESRAQSCEPLSLQNQRYKVVYMVCYMYTVPMC